MYQQVQQKEKEKYVFREYEKKYRVPAEISKLEKKKGFVKKETDFSDVIDFTNMEHNSPENKKLIVPVDITIPDNLEYIGKKPLRAYTLANVEGLYFIPNPFTPEQEKHWIKRCVMDFTVGNPTNVINLERQKDPSYPLWTEYKPEYKEPLRWATLGYHFQWTPRKYMDEFQGEFPADLKKLITELAELLNYKMTPEAATLNYYPLDKQCMCAHLDDAEDDMSKPIVSVSFGNTVVFLIGGRTRDIAPTAFFIRSGDVVLMGGESRFCYHGVPRMIQASIPDYLLPENSSPEWKSSSEYIVDSRINMNVRQVRIHKETDQKSSQ